MIDGAVRDGQSVTPKWDAVRSDRIPGVKVFETKNVLTGYGRLVEIYREDWGLDDEPVRQVYQSTLNPGEGSAWHAHGDTCDRLFVNHWRLPADTDKIACDDFRRVLPRRTCDSRERSSSRRFRGRVEGVATTTALSYGMSAENRFPVVGQPPRF